MASRGWQNVTAADIARMQAKQPQTAKPAKYHNVKVVVDGERFDSKREAQHWQELKLREKAGEIYGLRRQVPFDLLCPHGDGTVVVATYVADFIFYNTRSQRQHVQDVKGGRATKTALYQLKKKWLFLQSGIDIEEIG